MQPREMKDAWTKEEMVANREAWVDLLRSGELKQGIGRLYKKNADGSECFCVWGVACKMFGDNFVKYRPTSNLHQSDFSDSKNSEDTYVAPVRVMRAVGLDVDDQLFWHTADNTEIIYTLWGLNDDGKNFKNLADLIEANKFVKSKI